MFTADPKNQTQKTKGPEVSAASPGEAPDPDLNWGQERKKARQLGGGQIETRFASNPHQDAMGLPVCPKKDATVAPSIFCSKGLECDLS